jgi:hypothetical protein
MFVMTRFVRLPLLLRANSLSRGLKPGREMPGLLKHISRYGFGKGPGFQKHISRHGFGERPGLLKQISRHGVGERPGLLKQISRHGVGERPGLLKHIYRLGFGESPSFSRADLLTRVWGEARCTSSTGAREPGSCQAITPSSNMSACL